MTLDEARLILNLKNASEAEKEALLKVSGRTDSSARPYSQSDVALVWHTLQNYEHLFATNAPPAPKGKSGGGSGSFYVQSKIVRARERIEAEWKEAAKRAQQQSQAAEQPKQGGDSAGPNAP